MCSDGRALGDARQHTAAATTPLPLGTDLWWRKRLAAVALPQVLAGIASRAREHLVFIEEERVNRAGDLALERGMGMVDIVLVLQDLGPVKQRHPAGDGARTFNGGLTHEVDLAFYRRGQDAQPTISGTGAPSRQAWLALRCSSRCQTLRCAGGETPVA